MNELQIEKRQLESQVADLKLVLEGGPDAELESSLATAEVRMAEIDGELLKAKPPVPVQTRAMNPSPKADLLASWLRAGTPVEQRGDQQAVSRSGGSGSMPPNSLAGSNAVAGAAAGPCVGTLGVMIVSSIIGGTAV